MNAVFSTLLAVFGSFAATQAGAQIPCEVTSAANGNQLKIELLAVEGENFRFRANGTTFFKPLSILDESSRATVTGLAEKLVVMTGKVKIDFRTMRTSKASGAYDFDDKASELSPVVTLTNQHNQSPSMPVTARVMIIGRGVEDRGRYRVLGSEEFEVPAIQPGKSTEVAYESTVRILYDNRGYAKFGYRYSGYVVLLMDGRDVLFHQNSAAVPDKFPEKFAKLKPGGEYTASLDPVKGTNPAVQPFAP